MKVAKKFTDQKVYFAVSNKDDMSYELSEFGLSASGDKPVVAAKDSADQKFVMKDEFRCGCVELANEVQFLAGIFT